MIIRFSDNREVVFADYFVICLTAPVGEDNELVEANLECSVTVAGEADEGVTIGSGPISQYELAADASPRIVYAHGDEDALAAITSGDEAMASMYSAYILSSVSPAVAAAFSPGLLGAGLGGLAAAGGGGGTAGPVAVVMEIVGSIVLGPVVTGHGLTVTAYKEDGSVLATGTVASDGSYNIEITQAYTGNVLIVVVDTNTADDYFDEGAGEEKDLSVDLRAVGQVAGAGQYQISINALTELVGYSSPF